MAWYLAALSKYATFYGRSRRREYWWFLIVNCIVMTVLYVLDGALGLLTFGHVTGVLSSIYEIAIFVPSAAVFVRRLHDTGRSGMWALMTFVPVIGWFVLLFFTLQDSNDGINEYGPSPKGMME